MSAQSVWVHAPASRYGWLPVTCRYVWHLVALLVRSLRLGPRTCEQKRWRATFGDELTFRARRMGEVYHDRRFCVEPAWRDLARGSGYCAVCIGYWQDRKSTRLNSSH